MSEHLATSYSAVEPVRHETWQMDTGTAAVWGVLATVTDWDTLKA